MLHRPANKCLLSLPQRLHVASIREYSLINIDFELDQQCLMPCWTRALFFAQVEILDGRL